jgi:hypothetical protein
MIGWAKNLVFALCIFLVICLLISIMQFVLCILLFDFMISVMYLYGALVDCPVYAWLCVWLTGCVIVLRVGVSDLLFRNPTVFDMFPIELVCFPIFRSPAI